ncbi:MAG: glycosyltransferase family 4 protein [Bacteroidota bacterium]
MRSFLAFTSHTVDVMTKATERAASRNTPEPLANEVHFIDTKSGACRISLFRRLRRADYGTVYISLLQHVDSALIPAALGSKVVCHAHGNDLFTTRRADPVTRWARTRGMRSVARFIAVSDWTGEPLVQQGVETARVQVIPNGVNAAAFAASPVRDVADVGEAASVLLTVARLVPRKGHALVIEALRRLPDVAYLIMGEGSERACLERLARDTGVADRVRFVVAGYVPDTELPAYCHACDAVSMASQHLAEAGSVEGFGLAFLEANAVGKAVIGTRTGGIGRAVKHEHNALLCQPNARDWSRVVHRIDEVLAA